MAGILQRWFTKGLLKKYDRVSIPVTDLHDNVDYQMGAFELGQAAIAGNPNIGSIDRIYGVATNLDEGGDYNIDNLKEPGRYTWTTKVPGGIAIEGRTTENNKYGSLTVTKVGSGNDRKQVLNFGIDNTQYSRTNPGGNNPWGEFKQMAYNDGSITKVANIVTNVKGQSLLVKKSNKPFVQGGAKWIRVAKIAQAMVNSLIFSVYNYFNNTPQVSSFVISLDAKLGGGSITQIGSNGNRSVFSKIRIVNTKERFVYLDLYYDSSSANTIEYLISSDIGTKTEWPTMEAEVLTATEVPEKTEGEAYKTFPILDTIAYNGVAIPDVNGTIKKAEQLEAVGVLDAEEQRTPTKPSDYRHNLILQHLKTGTAVGFPTTTAWVTIIGFRAWVSDSGDGATEIGFDDYGGMFIRHGKGETWIQEWQEIAIKPETTLQTYNKGITE